MYDKTWRTNYRSYSELPSLRILLVIMKNIYLRKVEYSDLDLLFNWANDHVVRENSFNSAPIPYEEHIIWFKRMMEDSSILQFIMMNENNPVGQIRLNIEEDSAEISYSIAFEHRGKGYGQKILQLVQELIRKNRPDIKRLIAKVKPENIASNTLFEREKYTMKYFCYELEINSSC